MGLGVQSEALSLFEMTSFAPQIRYSKLHLYGYSFDDCDRRVNAIKLRATIKDFPYISS